jgi:hypothetical protein
MPVWITGCNILLLGFETLATMSPDIEQIPLSSLPVSSEADDISERAHSPLAAILVNP